MKLSDPIEESDDSEKEKAKKKKKKKAKTSKDESDEEPEPEPAKEPTPEPEKQEEEVVIHLHIASTLLIPFLFFTSIFKQKYQLQEKYSKNKEFIKIKKGSLLLLVCLLWFVFGTFIYIFEYFFDIKDS